MFRTILGAGSLAVLVIGGVLWLGASSERTDAAVVPPDTSGVFDEVAFASRIIQGWETKDRAMIADSMSDLYNEAGVSKQEALAQVDAMFQEFDAFEVHYRVLEFKQFPGTNLGALKAVIEVNARRPGESQASPILQTLGYASLIFENGDWKTYATQAAYSPPVPNFQFEAFTAQGWPAWGVQLSEAEIRDFTNSF